jgi:hypothetical protein
VDGEIVTRKDAGAIVVVKRAALQKTGMEKTALGIVIVIVNKMDAGNIIPIQVIALLSLQPRD